MPDLPDELAALVADLERLGFELELEELHRWPGGSEIRLRRPTGGGVTRVQLRQDRGIWEADVEIDGRWYEPFTCLRALDALPHEQRAFNHAERRAATIGLVERYTGDRAQLNAIKERAQQLSQAYTRWAAGKGEVPPR